MGGTPKWMVCDGKPYQNMDDLVVLYGNEPPHVVDEPTVCNLHAMQTMEP